MKKISYIVILIVVLAGISGCISTKTATSINTSTKNENTQVTTTKLDKIYVSVNKPNYNATILVPVEIAEEINEVLSNISVESIEIVVGDENMGIGFNVYAMKFPGTRAMEITIDSKPLRNGTIVTNNKEPRVTINYNGKIYPGTIVIKDSTPKTKAKYRVRFDEISGRAKLGSLIIPKLDVTIETFIEKTGESEYKVFIVWNNETIATSYLHR
ncbi:Hypothetical protein PAB1130 [Pyrococcus abyssi GE5]|uniref:Uncharacterized protein n=2 Tax=Pyrococcus abyssi TaxID=29292 RepID=Q9UXY4_PYRAB|nr:Hypothetical protein PAB1130 [Pyrococcus abyssi GE5]CCE71197.1 TPA: hypothetical protein PAB1130 [Pyrococcus abyssi GE5]